MLRGVLLLLLAGACNGEMQAKGETGVSRSYYCGESFALALDAGETVTSRSPVEDFVLHQVRTANGSLIIYEGNAPEPGGIVIRLDGAWPDQLVIHESPANPQLAGEIARRIVTGEQRQRHCSNRPVEPS